MSERFKRRRRPLRLIAAVLVVGGALAAVGATQASSRHSAPTGNGPFRGKLEPTFTEAVAFDVSKPLRELVQAKPPATHPTNEPLEADRDRGPVTVDRGYSGDGALQDGAAAAAPRQPVPGANFEGLSNQDNFDVFGFRVNPPDSNGAVGPNHYVEMINIVFAVYSKTGTRLLGPAAIGSLWTGFKVPDCTDPSGDPVVVYDRKADRWLLSQFTTRGFNDPAAGFYDCVAISQTSDPTGAYFRYAFKTQADPDGGFFFPDYPKYGVWTNTYVLTTRDFGTVDGYGISVYGLERSKMLAGKPNARMVQFFLDSAVVPINLIGDGLLPADIDSRRAAAGTPAPVVGTQDDGGPYGATSDALNIWELSVDWAGPTASLNNVAQLPVKPFDSVFPCTPDSRDCLPQPGITNRSQFLDILSYRQRPTFRLAYRKFSGYESLVTAQSVEARPDTAGMRWYEIRRTGGTYSVQQQGTYAPRDGVHRWMGSIAQDKKANMALGYSVVNGVDVFPGIRYTAREKFDLPGKMTVPEQVIVDGTGVQTSTNSRWGDYTAMRVDPVDDCTFWYVNEYYTLEGQGSSTVGWQTRIASFRMPNCS